MNLCTHSCHEQFGPCRISSAADWFTVKILELMQSAASQDLSREEEWPILESGPRNRSAGGHCQYLSGSFRWSRIKWSMIHEYGAGSCILDAALHQMQLQLKLLTLTCFNSLRLVMKDYKKCNVWSCKMDFSLWDTWQRCTLAWLFIAKVFPIKSRMPALSSLCRHCVNRDLAGLHVLYLITDRVGHLGHQSEYLNTYKIAFSLTASLRLIKFGLPEHRSSVRHRMHLPPFRWKSFTFQITAKDILTWMGGKVLFNSFFLNSVVVIFRKDD